MRKKVEISEAYKLKKNQRKIPTPKNEDFDDIHSEITPKETQENNFFQLRQNGTEAQGATMKFPKHIEAIN